MSMDTNAWNVVAFKIVLSITVIATLANSQLVNEGNKNLDKNLVPLIQELLKKSAHDSLCQIYSDLGRALEVVPEGEEKVQLSATTAYLREQLENTPEGFNCHSDPFSNRISQEEDDLDTKVKKQLEYEVDDADDNSDRFLGYQDASREADSPFKGLNLDPLGKLKDVDALRNSELDKSDLEQNLKAETATGRGEEDYVQSLAGNPYLSEEDEEDVYNMDELANIVYPSDGNTTNGALCDHCLMDYDAPEAVNFSKTFNKPPPNPEESLEEAKAKIVRIVSLGALIAVVAVVMATLGCFFAIRFCLKQIRSRHRAEISPEENDTNMTTFNGSATHT